MPSATESATCSLVMMPFTSASVGTPLHETTTRHGAAAPPHPLDHLEGDVVLARDGEITLRHVTERDAGIGIFKAAPQRGVDAQHAVDPVVADDDDVLHRALMLGLAQERIEIGRGRQDQHVGVHDVAGVAHQEHVGVQRLRDEMPRPTSLTV